jgi:hypothetical protein
MPSREAQIELRYSAWPDSPKIRPWPVGVTAPNAHRLSISPRQTLSQARATTAPSRRRPPKPPPRPPPRAATRPPPRAATQATSSRRHQVVSSRSHLGHLLAAPWPSPRSAKTSRYGRRPPSPGRAPTATRTHCIHAPLGRRAPTARAESSDGQGGKPATLASSIRWP